MNNSQQKPKLLYFMPSSESYPAIQMSNFVHRVRTGLSEFFEVVVISKDCDYAEVCDVHQPDIAMFDSGLEMSPCRVQVTNTSAFPEVPKIGHLRADAFSPNRTIFLSDMERWGIETFFTCETATAVYTPEIAGHVFYWPFFVDTALFRDYGESKSIPVLFTGNCEGPSLEYHWRIKIKALVSKRYPSLVVPHPGYTKDSPTFKVYGEQYARLINASMVVPTCGAMSKVVVMKHLEIPGAKACLLTERNPTVEAFGFIDMENSVFADEHDVIDKLNYLFSNRDVLERITNDGYELVHSKHTAKQRPQILQWLQLYRTLKPGQRIAQPGLFDDLVVEEKLEIRSNGLIYETIDRTFLKQGDEKVVENNCGEAEILYKKCFDYIEWMPEPRLRLALCELYKGDARGALEWLGQLLEPELGKYEAATPDPVEWAYFLITLLCRGDLQGAWTFSQYFPSLHHLELARARWAVSLLAGRTEEAEQLKGQMLNPPRANRSIHQLPQFPLEEYVRRLGMMLRACGQRQSARLLGSAGRLRPDQDGKEESPSDQRYDPASGSNSSDDIPYLLESLARMRRERRPKLSEKLKSRAPDLARGVNQFVSRHPRLKTKIKAAAIGYLKIQDW